MLFFIPFFYARSLLFAFFLLNISLIANHASKWYNFFCFFLSKLFSVFIFRFINCLVWWIWWYLPNGNHRPAQKWFQALGNEGKLGSRYLHPRDPANRWKCTGRLSPQLSRGRRSQSRSRSRHRSHGRPAAHAPRRHHPSRTQARAFLKAEGPPAQEGQSSPTASLVG